MMQKATGSLAWRAVVVSLCLLVLPLFLNTLYLYRTDYFDNINQARAILKLTVNAQKELIDQRIQLEWHTLEVAAQAGAGIEEMSTPAGVNALFAVISEEREALLVGRQLEGGGSLVISTPLSALFQMLKQFETGAFPTALALVGPQGELLAGVKEETSFFIQTQIEGTELFLYLSIPKGAVQGLSKTSYFFHFIALFLFIAIIGGALVGALTQRIARPLRRLSETMARVSEGAFHARYAPDKMGFEINALGQQFNETLDQLLHHQEEAQRERLGRERLAQELKIGHEIQVSLLPKQLPQFGTLEIAAGFVPALEVGGDFYDLFPYADGKLLVAIADVAGKGVSACLYSLGLRSMLRALATRNPKLSDILLQASQLFWQDVREANHFVTLWIGLYDPEKRKLEYASQGHPPALLIEKEEMRELTTSGLPLGIEPFVQVKTEVIALQPGSLLFLYTDGITESHNREGALFGISRLKRTLQGCAQLPAQTVGERVLHEVSQFSEKAIQHDDMTFVVLRF